MATTKESQPAIVDTSPMSPTDDELTLAPKIRRNLLMAKIFYFLTFCGSASCSPYNGVFLYSRGFTASQVGLILSFFPAVRILVVPYVSYLCDRRGWGMPILTLCFAIGGLATVMNGAVSVESTAENQKNSGFVLFLVAFFFFFQALCKGPTSPISDQLTMELLPPERRKEWGDLRSFGSYGWGIGAPIFAQLITVSSYFWSFIFYPLLGLIGVFALNSTTKLTSRPTTKRDFGEVLRFLTLPQHRRTLVLLIFSVLMGTGLSIISTYLFIYLQQDLNAPQLLLGLTISGMVVVEVPIFHCSHWLHSKFSNRSLLLIAMTSWSLRVTGYSFLPNAWLVLFFEPLHGLTFGCSWLAAVNALSSTFPPELNASAFGLLHSSVNGVGTILGTVFGGYGYDFFGARVFFRLCAVIMLGLSLAYYVLDKRMELTHPPLVVPTSSIVSAPPAGDAAGKDSTELYCQSNSCINRIVMENEEPRTTVRNVSSLAEAVEANS